MALSPLLDVEWLLCWSEGEAGARVGATAPVRLVTASSGDQGWFDARAGVTGHLEHGRRFKGCPWPGVSPISWAAQIGYAGVARMQVGHLAGRAAVPRLVRSAPE